MALQTYVSPGVYDTMIGSATITATTAALTLAGITSTGVTAPSLLRAATGCWICVSVVPANGGNITVEIMESGVSKKTGTINNADIQLGMNYVRFATSYTFATLTASAYTARVKNSVGTSGSLRTAASGLWFQFTYDTAGALGTSDDLWVGGFNDAGLTPKNHVGAGTFTCGSKATTAIGSTTQTMGAAVTIGSGGTFSYDQTANVNFTIKGSFWYTAGGTLDLRPPSNKSIIHTTIIDSTANGDQGIFSAQGATGGVALTSGASYTQFAKYASGTGTAADPLTLQSAHGFSVGDEIVVPGIAYNTNQIRFVITVVNTTQVVVSTTSGGAEAAITNTPAVGSHISNLTRNSIIKPLTTNLGYYIHHSSNVAGNFDYTRFEHSDNNSGKSITLSGGLTGAAVSSFDGIVGYQNSNGSAGRHWLAYPATGTPASAIATHSNITAYNTGGSYYNGQSGFTLQAVSNKTIYSYLHYNGPSTTTCGTISLYGSAVNNTLVECHSYGANAGNSAGGYSFGNLSASNNTINSCTVNNCRQNAVLLSIVADTTFNNCNFGNIGTNTVDIFTNTNSLNTNILFNNCGFYSATMLSNYRNQLGGSEMRFHAVNGVAHKHYWYQKTGWAETTGPSLSDTTVKTAGSYNVKINPEDNTVGFSWLFNIKATVDQIAFLKAYLRKNTTMGASVAKVELFLPGTLLTDTPDATFTASSTPDVYQDFVISKAFVGTENTEARVRVTAISSTAGAAVYIANLYDSVEALNSWYEGKPSKLVVPTDFSSVPGLMWSFPSTGATSGTMGYAMGLIPRVYVFVLKILTKVGL